MQTDTPRVVLCSDTRRAYVQTMEVIFNKSLIFNTLLIQQAPHKTPSLLLYTDTSYENAIMLLLQNGRFKVVRSSV
jgi:hypothetical protein